MEAKKLFLTIAGASAVAALSAEIKMPSIFSDDMVFQRSAPVKVWGTASAGAKVDVEFAGQKKSVVAAADGSWSLRLAPMKADKTPANLSVSENGKPAKTLNNVLVGEVWILGGQSNMQWSANNTTDYQKLKARADNPNIRYFNQQTKTVAQTPQKDSVNGKWIVCSPSNVGYMSASGIYFGEQLQKDLDVPVGLVFTALGASKMVAWIPEDAVSRSKYVQKEFNSFKDALKKYDFNKAYAEWKVKAAEWDTEAAKAKAEKRKPNPEYRPFEPNKITDRMPAQTPSYLYNGVIAPIAGFSARGVLWYQGESDSYGETLDNFCEQFELLVSVWREKFDNPNLWFVWTQLTSIGKGSGWPMTRWRQYLSSKNIKGGAVANLIDLGEQNDVHPRDKTSVGLRFEKLVLQTVYGFKDARGKAPEPAGVKYSGAEAAVSFESFSRKLEGRGEPRGFEVLCGEKWVAVKPVLKGSKVILRSPDGAEISGVRYLWTAWAQPDAWLFNQDGLPAFSFTHQK